MLQAIIRQRKATNNKVALSRKGRFSSKTIWILIKGQHVQRKRSFLHEQFLHCDVCKTNNSRRLCRQYFKTVKRILMSIQQIFAFLLCTLYRQHEQCICYFDSQTIDCFIGIIKCDFYLFCKQFVVLFHQLWRLFRK